MFKIVIFKGKKPETSQLLEPYKKIAGKKYPVYIELFDELAKVAEVYTVFGYENYLGNLAFQGAQRYTGKGMFSEDTYEVVADAVYDRSYRLDFPGSTELENKKIVNCRDFKEFSRDKYALSKKYPKFCPETVLISGLQELESNLDGKLNMVYKPVTGMKGKGIQFVKQPSDIKTSQLSFPGIIQKFMETSEGIPDLLKGRHDLRVVVIDSEIVWATVRRPAGNNMLANVAQGGSIAEIPKDDIPLAAIKIVNQLSRDFSSAYYNPLFSVDLGFKEGVPFIFEINDQIGFPGPEMKNNTFIKRLAGSLLARARIE